MRIGLSSASRSGMVSWSASKDSETAQRAPPGHDVGASERPPRARPTILRHSGSDHSHGFGFGSLIGDLLDADEGTVDAGAAPSIRARARVHLCLGIAR
jgi:hypothetical protein